MNNLKTALGLTAALVLASIFYVNIFQPVKVLSMNDPDIIAIQRTLRTYVEITDEASYTLDDSRLSEVLANDLRGGLVDPIYLKSVRYMKGKPDLTRLEIGFLDVNQARWAFEREVKEVYDQAVASGKVIIPASPSDQIRPNPSIVSEIRAMEAATGLVAGLPVPRTEEKKPTGFRILSISVLGDLAYAKVDWEYGLCKDIFVKKGGSWYLVGHQIIQRQAG